MKLNNLVKYFFRFILLQTILTSLTIVYFDNFLISNQEFKQNIYENLVADTERFFPLIPYELITVDAFFSIMIFFFLIILYSTKFYTYVNELSFSVNKNLLDEYFQIYLLWTSYLFASFYIFRFDLSNYLTSLLFLSYVALLLYQIKIFNLNQPLSCLRAFKLNNLNGIAMFLLIVTITL